MTAQLTHQGTPPRSAPTSRELLRTRPRHQRFLIRSWEYIPAVRAIILSLRLLAMLVLFVTSIVLLSNSVWWGAPMLVVAFALVPFSLWIYTTAAKGWPER